MRPRLAYSHARPYAKTSGGTGTFLFRDYLRQNRGVAAEYAALKKELAQRDWADVNDYADAKTDFIRGIESEARSVQNRAV